MPVYMINYKLNILQDNNNITDILVSCKKEEEEIIKHIYKITETEMPCPVSEGSWLIKHEGPSSEIMKSFLENDVYHFHDICGKYIILITHVDQDWDGFPDYNMRELLDRYVLDD
jgi:hypothetical protein